MAKLSAIPTDRFTGIVKLYESLNAAAEAWDVEYVSLKRCMKGKGLSLATALKISARLGMPVEQLFHLKNPHEKG